MVIPLSLCLCNTRKTKQNKAWNSLQESTEIQKKEHHKLAEEIATKDLKAMLLPHEVPQLQIFENRPYVLGGKNTCLVNQLRSPAHTAGH